MSLYLCVFASDGELEGVELGAYSDFDHFRSTVTEVLEGGAAGSAFPTLVRHSNCDGEWTAADCHALMTELMSIAVAFRELPPRQLPDGWQRSIAEGQDLVPQNLYQSFIDVDGLPLIGRLLDLCRRAVSSSQPILFQ